jgi:hypothetical protein
LNLTVFASFLAFARLVGIPTAFETVISQKEIEENSSPLLSSNFGGNNDDIILSEEICPPYCNPPPPIQEIPKEQIP